MDFRCTQQLKIVLLISFYSPVLARGAATV